MGKKCKLNLGGGNWELPGYTNVELANGDNAYPLDYETGSVDEIRASHLLEHWSYEETAKVLAEWKRALKPAGWLKIAVPDFDLILKEYQKGRREVETWIMGHSKDSAGETHGALFTNSKLRALFRQAGLIDVQRWKSKHDDDASNPISLNLKGKKPSRQVAAGLKKPFKIRACMSMPRLGFMDNFHSAMAALAPLGITVNKQTGPFWQQAIEKSFEEVVGDADAILAIDYDTIFCKQDVQELIYLLRTHPKMDAIAPIEQGRHWDSPLFTATDEDGNATQKLEIGKLANDTMKVPTAHFGLTLLRTRALKNMSHPWFRSKPNDEGRWDEGKTDADVAFWKKWNEADNRLYLANHVVVGHAELFAIWPDRKLQPIQQRIQDYHANGKPKECWQ